MSLIHAVVQYNHLANNITTIHSPPIMKNNNKNINEGKNQSALTHTQKRRLCYDKNGIVMLFCCLASKMGCVS